MPQCQLYAGPDVSSLKQQLQREQCLTAAHMSITRKLAISTVSARASTQPCNDCIPCIVSCNLQRATDSWFTLIGFINAVEPRLVYMCTVGKCNCQ